MERPIVCLSHLRWDFVYQRPNHLMARAARDRRVLYVQELELHDGRPTMRVRREGAITVATPLLREGIPTPERRAILAGLVADLASAEEIERPWVWLTTPMMLHWAARLAPEAVVYDCMDELSAFRAAPAELRVLEASLLDRADVVFTGGMALYEARRSRHPNVHPFPSSVDAEHFRQARQPQPESPEQAGIPGPRIGWFGVIDERFDLDLVRDVARARPAWSIVLVGPVTKIDDGALPTEPNIHWLGLQPYSRLPAFLSGWDVAIMPFARNESTRFISPTKTPEYLAGGRPVVSTPIADVVEPYGRLGLVRLAADAPSWVRAIEAALDDDLPALAQRADRVLAGSSWDATWAGMEARVRDAIAGSGRAGEAAAIVGAPRQALARQPRPLSPGNEIEAEAVA